MDYVVGVRVPTESPTEPQKPAVVVYLTDDWDQEREGPKPSGNWTETAESAFRFGTVRAALQAIERYGRVNHGNNAPRDWVLCRVETSITILPVL